MDVYLIPTLNCLNKTSGYTEARIITSEPNSLTEQDTEKVSERLVGKQLYSAFQLLCITICITTKETNFKVQALHESSMGGCQGAPNENIVQNHINIALLNVL